MSYTSTMNEQELAESPTWPVVPAGPGFAMVDESCREVGLEPVLAWRVGANVTLPVTRVGFKPNECWILYPDGRVRHHGLPGRRERPEYASLDEFCMAQGDRDSERAR